MPLVGKRRQIDEESNDRLDQSYTDRSDVYDGESDPPSAPPVGGPQQLPTSKVWNQLAVVAGVFSVVLFLHQRGAVFPRESRISLRYAASQQTGRAAASEPSLTDAPKPSFVLPPRIDEVVLPDSIGGGGLRKAGLQITSWNLATPGNPFEYHFGGDAPGDAVLKQFSTALLGLQDTVEAVFTPDMFTELKNTMSRVYTLQPCLDNKWETYKGMKVAEFLQRIEEKGVIKSIDAKTNPFLQLRVDAEHRPTPAGCGAVPEGGVAEWWKKWHTFMFDTEATSNKGSGNIFGLVRESSCLGVDVLALGVFDAIMVHTFEKTQGWREVKEALCETLHGANAAKKIIAGLREHHASSDIVMLQNVDAKLLEAIREDEFGKSFSIKSPSRFENDRKHNSVVLFRTGRFLGITEVTGDIHFGSLSHSDLGGKIAVFTATRLDREATKMIIASVSGSHTLIDSIHDYTVTHSPIRSLFAALFRVESDADKALSFAPNRHLSVVSGKSWTRFYSKTHAQKDFSLGVAPSEKNSGTKVVTEYLISPGGMKASEDVQTTVLGQEGTVLPTTAHPAVSAAITCLYSHIEPILTEKKLQEQYSGLIKEIVAKLMTFTPTGVPTEVPSTGVPVVGGEASTYEETIPTTAPVQMMELNGSIILPPEGVRDYVGVEKGELWPKASQVPGAMTVTAVCDNGLGDRLGSLYSAIHLAWTLNAKFHIIWNMNNECRARVSTLFEWDGSSSSVANKSAGDNLEMRLQGQGQAYDAVITLKHHFSTGSLVNFDNGSPTPPVGDEPWLCGESRKVNLAPDGQIVQWALARQKYVYFFKSSTPRLRFSTFSTTLQKN